MRLINVQYVKTCQTCKEVFRSSNGSDYCSDGCFRKEVFGFSKRVLVGHEARMSRGLLVRG